MYLIPIYLLANSNGTFSFVKVRLMLESRLMQIGCELRKWVATMLGSDRIMK